MTDDKTKALLDDLAGAEHDILSLAQRHGLSLPALVDWACNPQMRRTVAGLCVLADAQTQLLLSRYRLVAATRLIGQATADAESLAPEQVRKACVDLLKTELSRADTLGLADAGKAPDSDSAPDPAIEALARAMTVPDEDHDFHDQTPWTTSPPNPADPPLPSSHHDPIEPNR